MRSPANIFDVIILNKTSMSAYMLITMLIRLKVRSATLLEENDIDFYIDKFVQYKDR